MCIAGIVDKSLHDTPAPFETLMLDDVLSVQCDAVCETFSATFGIVDVSPDFIVRPNRHQEQSYSINFKRPFVKGQAIVTPDDQCMIFSKPFRGSPQDTAIFGRSGTIDFLREHDETSRERSKFVLVGLGYVWIQRRGARALLPHNRPRGQELTQEQKAKNQLLSHDRIIIAHLVDGKVYSECAVEDIGAV
jgi:hypothetical protein